MLKVIAGLVAGLVLGISGTAIASTAGLWSHNDVNYSCQGIRTGFICKDKNSAYRVAFTPKYAGVFRGSIPVVGCIRNFAPMSESCVVDSSVPQG